MNQWHTGNYSYNDLLKLTTGLSHLKYFPTLGTMFDDTDSLRVGIEGKVSPEQKESYERDIRDLAKSFGFGVDFYGTLKFRNLKHSDLEISHFEKAVDLEAQLIKLLATYNCLPEEPYKWKENGFVPEQS